MTCKMILVCVGVTKYLGTLSSAAVVRRSVRGLREIFHRVPGEVGNPQVRLILQILPVFLHGGGEVGGVAAGILPRM